MMNEKSCGLKKHHPTASQKRLWTIQNLNENDTQYNACFCISIKGPLLVNKVRTCFQKIFNRHSAFKTGFLSLDELYLKDEINVDFRFENITAQHLALDQEQKLMNEVMTRYRIPFDLKVAPLARIHLLQLDSDTFLLLFVSHHIISDAYSYTLILEEFKSLYAAEEFEELADNKECIIEENHLTQTNVTASHDYWNKKLTHASTLDFPTDKPRNPHKANMREYLFDLDPKLIPSIRCASKSLDTTTFKYLLTCYAILLHRYTQQDKFIVGIPTHGRLNASTQNQIGFFVKLLPILMEFDESLDFITLLNKVTVMVNEAVENQEVPYIDLLNNLKLPRDALHDPLFNNHFNFAFFDAFCDFELLDLKVNYFWISSGFTNSDFGMMVSRLNERHQISFKYDDTVFELSTIKRLSEHWQNIINSVLLNPHQKIAAIHFLNDSEYQQLAYLNVKTSPVPEEFAGKTIIDVFEYHYTMNPNRLAVLGNEQQLTYRELHEKTDRLAAHLRDNFGITQGDVVAVLFGHEIDLLVSILAIVRCGATYVSIDNNYPPSRIQYILDDCKAKVFITKSELFTDLQRRDAAFFPLQSIFLMDQEPLASAQSFTPVDISPEDLVYIVYTSGTTGKPKGVKTTHQGLLNLARFEQRELKIEADSRILQFAAVGFDALAWEWASSVYSGASLVFANQFVVGDELASVIKQFAITHITLPPSILQTLRPEKASSLKTVVVAGEACTATIIANWSSHVRLINAYGPSENTVCSTFFNTHPDYPAATIGKNIDHVQVYILDKYNNIAPIGCIGEIHLGGKNLSPGYLNQLALTDEKFIDNPIGNKPGKLYKTGDLAKLLPDGNIVFLGRIDFQIKLRGFRIELDDIIAQICQIPEIEHAEILLINNEQAPAYLAAFVVFFDKNINPEVSKARVKTIEKQLKKQLPGYMIPETFVVLAEIPLTENKKVNRNQLLEHIKSMQTSTSDFEMSPYEARMLHLWQQVLHKDQISLKDNFFDLGGHSLSATQLVEKIRQEFNIEFKTVDLYHNPSIHQLTQYLDHQESHNSLLVPLSSGKAKKILYCLHPIGGNVLCYLPLAKRLQKKADLVGICSLGLSNQNEPLETIYDMAQYYFNEIKKQQNDGPYYLLGYCMGGLIAYELAKLFLEQGNELGQVIIIDTYNAKQAQQISPLSSEHDFIALFLRMSLVTAGKMEHVDASVAIIYESDQPFMTLTHILEKYEIYQNQKNSNELSRMINIVRANYLALTQYVFSPATTLLEGCFVYSKQTIKDLEGHSDSIFSQPIFKKGKMVITDSNHEQMMLEEYLSHWIYDCFGEWHDE